MPEGADDTGGSAGVDETDCSGSLDAGGSTFAGSLDEGLCSSLETVFSLEELPSSDEVTVSSDDTFCVPSSEETFSSLEVISLEVCSADEVFSTPPDDEVPLTLDDTVCSLDDVLVTKLVCPPNQPVRLGLWVER